MVVATDAIGMGVSLPIKRVVFCETKKYDGRKFRHLRNHEIKQIAGRAGRFGKYPLGEVLTMTDPDDIQNALESTCRNIDKFTLPFPAEVFKYSNDIELVLSEWERLFPMEMKTITAPLIRELIDHIEVHETEGEGKYKTQRIVIFYRFVGYIEIPESAFSRPLTKDTRQGVSVSYIPKALPA